MQASNLSGEINFLFRKELVRKHKDEKAFFGIPNAVSPVFDRAQIRQLYKAGCAYTEGSSAIRFKQCNKEVIVKQNLFKWNMKTPLVF